MSRSARARREVRDGLWEKLLVVAACVVAVSLAFAGARREFSHYSQDGAATTVQAIQTTEQPSSDVAGAAATPATGERRSEGAPAAPTPLDRADCDAMRGTRLRTRGERQWFIDNCLFLARRANQLGATGGIALSDQGWTVQPDDGWRSLLRAAGFSLAEPAPRRSALEFQATPPPWLSGRDAVDLVIDWMTSNSPVALVVEPADCISIWLNGHWIVTCQVGLTGCTGQRCVASLSLCVFSDPVVVPDPSC